MADYKLVLPVIKEDTLEILYYVDEEGSVYSDLKEILEIGTTYLFCYYLKLVYQEFERIVAEKELAVKLSARPYTGNPKNDFVAPRLSIKLGSDQPEIFKTRAKYKGKKIYFLDIDKFIGITTDFNVKPADIPEHHAAIKAFISEILPHIPRETMPNSIAAAARKIFKCETSGKKLSYLNEIRSAYLGGYYYIKNTWEYNEIIYDYDIKSMYPAILNSNRLFPSIATDEAPERLKGFHSITNEKPLAFYHIKVLKAMVKDKHFPTIWKEKRLEQLLNKYGTCRYGYINCRINTLAEGWITSIDYHMLKRDYDIGLLEIDYTYLIEGVPGSLMFSSLGKFFNLKESSVGATREVYKKLIDSFSGSLGMMPKTPHYWASSLDGHQKIFNTPEKEPDTCSPVDIAAFLTAYGRYEITELAYKNGFDNTYSIDTDGIFALDRTLDAECGEGLGSLRLDKIMRNARWFGQKQYESIEDNSNELTPHIAGLPAYLYKPGCYDYMVPSIQYSKKLKKFIRYEQPFVLSQEDN